MKKPAPKEEYRRCLKSFCRFVDYADAMGPNGCCPRCGNETEAIILRPISAGQKTTEGGA